MNIGVLFGPASGRGAAAEISSRLSDRFGAYEVAVVSGRFGCDPLPCSWTKLTLTSRADYVEELQAAVASLLDWGAGILCCVGGDGIASYTLDAMARYGKDIPLLGIAAGTINVGPVIAFSPNEVSSLDIEKLAIRRIDAVEVLAGETHIAYALNDVVIGNSFLGTLNGSAVSLSSRALLREGKKKIAEPSTAIATETFALRKNEERIDVALRRPAQIIASPLGRREFFGRAVAGILCNTAFMQGAAAIGLFDEVIVKTSEPTHGFRGTARSEHLLFGPNDLIEISGLAEDADIIVDGNPYARENRSIQLRFISAIAKVYMPAYPGLDRQGLPPEEALK